MHPTRPPASPALSRRSFLLGATGVGASLALAGCAGASGSASGPTTISFYVSKPEVLTYFDTLIAKFHAEQSAVRVVRDSTSNMSADFVRNNPPDLGCWNYNFSVVEFVERGALSDLSDMAEAKRINPDLTPLMNQTASFPGRTSAIPYAVAGASVLFSVDLFEKHGVEVPTTWDDLIAACKTFEAAGVSPFYNTYKDTWTIAQGMFDYSIGGMVDVPGLFRRLDAEGASVGSGSATSFEKDLEGPMAKMVELTKYSNKDASSRAYGDGNLGFSQGKGAMYLQGPWALNEIAKTNAKMRIGSFPLPMTNDPHDLKIRVNVDLALWIPEVSKKQEAARTFLRFLMRPEIQDKYNADNNTFGTTKDAPPTKNPALVGMQKYYDDAAFYLGVSQLIPSEIPVANYAQSIALGSAARPVLTQLDGDWSRLALRRS
ncbi:ABC transporter substrate-binding protein [Frondihabitans australicus]|uniref:Carbohydrate ABC transporter substrate-binding protein (CUT1 family) n=1 Tax=Frondihabitans australicus TaxID=386892 RepID=A0A495IG61_9MICO|nr:substrate-binding domain-containing protein [Frondihabitans australicus]RKR74997.1 carbohydrate ABC transporter substrate-binding protein (CUT1 family) [Frondihabitans australicus]